MMLTPIIIEVLMGKNLDDKTCSHCGETKPLSEFYKNKKREGKYLAKCIKCFIKFSSSRKEQNKQYNAVNKEHQKEYHKQWALENKEANKEQQKQWRLENKKTRKEYNLENKEANKEFHKQYELDHKKERKEYNKQYNLDNKEKAKQYSIDNTNKIKEYGKKYRDAHKKEYHKEYNKQYGLENKEEISEANRKYRDKHQKKEKICIICGETKLLNEFEGGKRTCNICVEQGIIRKAEREAEQKAEKIRREEESEQRYILFEKGYEGERVKRFKEREARKKNREETHQKAQQRKEVVILNSIKPLVIYDEKHTENDYFERKAAMRKEKKILQDITDAEIREITSSEGDTPQRVIKWDANRYIEICKQLEKTNNEKYPNRIYVKKDQYTISDGEFQSIEDEQEDE